MAGPAQPPCSLCMAPVCLVVGASSALVLRDQGSVGPEGDHGHDASFSQASRYEALTQLRRFLRLGTWRGHQPPPKPQGGLMTAFQFLPGADNDLMVVLLDGFGLFRGSTLLSVPRASQRLVAFLALHGGMVRRAAVAGTLWPDASERHAYSNLRQALARLQRTARKALAASKLELGLAEGVTVDIRHARTLARRLLDPAVTPEQSELGTAAVGVLSAELLPDWYDDWLLLEAEDWRQLRLHALEGLAARLAAAGRWGDAVGAACAAVRADPLRESARACLIQVHLAEGNQSEAVREFARYQALLHGDLGLEPTSRLRHLIEGLHSS